MDIDELVNRFVELSIKYGEAAEIGDYKTINRCYEQRAEIVSELDKLGKRSVLLSLLDHENPAVRLTAAARILRINAKRASKVLKALSKDNQTGIIGIDAQMVLKEWKKGDFDV